MNSQVTPPSFLINTAYMCSLALDLMVRRCEEMLPRDLKVDHEQKMALTQFTKCIQRAKTLSDQFLTQFIYDADEKHGYKNIQTWQEEANELARLLILYADRSANVDTVEKIHAFIRSLPGEGYSTEEMLSHFYLKKL